MTNKDPAALFLNSLIDKRFPKRKTFDYIKLKKLTGTSNVHLKRMLEDGHPINEKQFFKIAHALGAKGKIIREKWNNIKWEETISPYEYPDRELTSSKVLQERCSKEISASFEPKTKELNIGLHLKLEPFIFFRIFIPLEKTPKKPITLTELISSVGKTYKKMPIWSDNPKDGKLHFEESNIDELLNTAQITPDHLKSGLLIAVGRKRNQLANTLRTYEEIEIPIPITRLEKGISKKEAESLILSNVRGRTKLIKKLDELTKAIRNLSL